MSRAAKKAEEKEQQNRQALQAQITGFAQDVGTDYTPEQKASIRAARLGGLDIGFENLADQLARRRARTGSTAGFNDTLLELGREQARQKSQASQDIESEFAQEPVRRALLRAGIYTPLYGGSTEFASRIAPQAYSGGLLGKILSGAAGAAGGYLTGGIPGAIGGGIAGARGS